MRPGRVAEVRLAKAVRRSSASVARCSETMASADWEAFALLGSTWAMLKTHSPDCKQANSLKMRENTQYYISQEVDRES